MADSYTYHRRRADLLRPISYSDVKMGRVAVLPDPDARAEPPAHATRNPNSIELGNFPLLSENIVNTERVITLESTVLHSEGGWPKEVDITDRNEMKKFVKKKLEKTNDNTDKFTAAVKKLTENVESILLKNNEIDMFEDYFPDEEPETGAEALSLKTLTLFRLPGSERRGAVSSLSWHPDGPTKIAVSYTHLGQSGRGLAPPEAAIWDIHSPNSPVDTFQPSFPINKLAFNHKNAEQICFGCTNGIVGVWDAKAGEGQPQLLSPVEASHHESVADIAWLSSKGASEFVSCSTDGTVKWWDIRNLEKPTDELRVTETPGTEAGRPVLGATALEYVADYGPKYLLGTESGAIVLATKKPKKSVEINFNSCYGLDGIGRHLGPTLRISRNPFFPRYFLSLGDWSVNIWEDDIKTPIVHSRYHHAFLSDAAWSPVRPGLFAVTRRDGWLDLWDYYFRQNVVSLSHRVSSSPLTCLKFNTPSSHLLNTSTPTDAGMFLAIGDAAETVTLLKLCGSLYKPISDERTVISEIFDREKAREEIFKKQRLERSKLIKDREKQDRSKPHEEEKLAKELEKLEQDFELLIATKTKELEDVFGVVQLSKQEDNEPEPQARIETLPEESEENKNDTQVDEPSRENNHTSELEESSKFGISQDASGAQEITEPDNTSPGFQPEEQHTSNEHKSDFFNEDQKESEHQKTDPIIEEDKEKGELSEEQSVDRTEKTEEDKQKENQNESEKHDDTL